MEPPPKTPKNVSPERRFSKIIQEKIIIRPKIQFEWSVNERSELFFAWSLIVSLACLYNLLGVTILVYEEFRFHYFAHWLTLNATSDVIYVIDIFVQSRKNFYQNGVKVTSAGMMRKKYMKSADFILDVLSLVPFDVFLIFSPDISILRLNRMLKSYRLEEAFSLAERRTTWHTFFSISRIVLICVLLFHWNACAYYAISTWSTSVMTTVDEDDWPFTILRIGEFYVTKCGRRCVFYGEDNVEDRDNYAEELARFWQNKSELFEVSLLAKEYSQTIYWSSLTMTTLGEQPSPNLSVQNIFEIFDTIVGMLIFAMIMGSVADLIEQSNAFKSNIQQLIDGLKEYMEYRQLETPIQARVLNYCKYILSQNIICTEENVRSAMPSKLFFRVNRFVQPSIFDRSSLFRKLERPFLHDIASLFHLVHYGPGDVITTFGDFSKEMYVVCSGRLIITDEKGNIARELEDGDMVGDTTLVWLSSDRTNHTRTFTLTSEGFSDVYILTRDQMNELLFDYPILRKSLVSRSLRIQHRDGLLTSEKAEEIREQRTFHEKVSSLREGVRSFERNLNEQTDLFTHKAIKRKQRVHVLETLFQQMAEDPGGT